jgi:hypothetical protein
VRTLAIITLLAAGCVGQSAPPAPQDMDGTAAMVARLAALADSTESNPAINAHANKARVARLLENGPPPDPGQRMFWQINLGQERLRAGDNEGAIADLENVLAGMESAPAAIRPNDRLAVMDFLAIAYLRLGEQENCIDDPTADRCIWPIVESGVHKYPRGSTKAIDQYERILAEDPDDLNSLWLLNVAYMTLGAWPEGVPAKWRLPSESAESEFELPRFVDRAASTGLDVEGLSGGVVMEDLDGDGLLDLMMSSWGSRDQLRLFLNTGDGTFRDHTEAAGLTGITSGLNLVHADYDNDGDADVFVLRGAWLYHGYPNSLLRNDGKAGFVDVTLAAGLGGEFPSHSAAWADFNGDGLLDLFVGNESNPNAGLNPSQLFQNKGDGTFRDAALSTGLRANGYVKGAVWGDVNQDGRPDLFVSNLYGANQLHLNLGPDDSGTWKFREAAVEAGVTEPLDSFPTWFWDYDQDGHLDLFVSGWRAMASDVAAEYQRKPFKAEPPRLFRNRGDGTFDNVTAEAGLRRVMYTMGANFGDLDGDGWLDFYVGTGDPDFRALMPNRMFRNDGRGGFQEVTASGGFGHLQKGHGVAFGDLDQDGDQDVFAVMGGAFEGDVFRNVLFENPLDVPNWATFRLIGQTSNRSAIGARIRAVTEYGDIYRTVGTGGSFGSSSLRVYVGMGPADRIQRLEIWWPTTGQTQVLTDLPGRNHYAIVEGASQAEVLDLPAFKLNTEAVTHDSQAH